MRLISVLLALVTLAWAISLRAEVFGAKQIVLENGLRVVAVEINRAPVVTHMVWYRAGAMDEPQASPGWPTSWNT